MDVSNWIAAAASWAAFFFTWRQAVTARNDRIQAEGRAIVHARISDEGQPPGHLRLVVTNEGPGRALNVLIYIKGEFVNKKVHLEPRGTAVHPLATARDGHGPFQVKVTWADSTGDREWVQHMMPL